LIFILVLSAASCSADDAPADATNNPNPGGDTPSPPGNEPDKGNETDTEPGNAAGNGEAGDKEPEEVEPPQKQPPTPVFGFIDAHADTISQALLPHNNANLYRNELHVDFLRLKEYGAPVQVFALWCSDAYVDTAFDHTNRMLDFFESEAAKHSDIIEIALTLEDLERNARNNKISAILSIEGGEALMGDVENVDHFYNRGVRIMSLTWNRENELGYGQATGSKEGIKPFGAEVLARMEELGMILDVSHINEAGFWDAHRLSTRPYMASHSNTYAITPHDRNLTNDQIRAMVDSGGIIGLVLYPQLLTQRDNANMNDIVAHISHFINLGAGANLGLGGDLDGFGTMPQGFTCVSSYGFLAEKITESFGEEASLSIMSGNFYDFFVRYYRGI